jgi:hypothetical protein
MASLDALFDRSIREGECLIWQGAKDSAGENTMRGHTGRHNKIKTQCRNGHPFNAENTYVPQKGTRHCRICSNAASKKHQGYAVAA